MVTIDYSNTFHSNHLCYIWQTYIHTSCLSNSLAIHNLSMHPFIYLSPNLGCHLFCTTPLNSQFLRVMVAVKNKVNMFLWKHLASSTSIPMTPVLSFNPVDGFVKHRVRIYCTHYLSVCLSYI